MAGCRHFSFIDGMLDGAAFPGVCFLALDCIFFLFLLNKVTM